tara:strand:+ start:4380 stop:5282 length:903 start_codon:yes stop_codon:yes gene_type:complete
MSTEAKRPTPEQAIAIADPIITRVARRRRLPGMDHEDIAQMLRIEALRMQQTYDPKKCDSFAAYFTSNISRRMCDLYRTHGELRRDGERRRVQAVSFETLSRKISASSGFDTQFDAECNSARLEIAAIEWRDLIEATAGEEPVVRMMAMRLGGMTLEEIGKATGVSDSRVCQLISRNRCHAIKRLKNLFLEPSMRALKTEMDDRQAGKLQRALAATKGTATRVASDKVHRPKPRRKTRQPKPRPLSERIENLLSDRPGGLPVELLAEAFDTSPTAVKNAVGRSESLRQSAGIVTIVGISA